MRTAVLKKPQRRSGRSVTRCSKREAGSVPAIVAMVGDEMAKPRQQISSDNRPGDVAADLIKIVRRRAIVDSWVG
jgi:hypothetical protein